MQKNILFATILALTIGVMGGYAYSNQQNIESEDGSATTSIRGYGMGIGQGNGRFGEESKGYNYSKQNCLAEDCLLVSDLEYPVGELPIEVANVLDEALLDEYKAHATYEAVIEKFGSVRPFSMIIRSEEQHIASLKAIYDKYGLEIPSFADSIVAPQTLQEACQIGVDAEIANAALYRDILLPAVSEYPEISAVFTNLMNASQEKHLPAFERCN